MIDMTNLSTFEFLLTSICHFHFIYYNNNLAFFSGIIRHLLNIQFLLYNNCIFFLKKVFRYDKWGRGSLVQKINCWIPRI